MNNTLLVLKVCNRVVINEQTFNSQKLNHILMLMSLFTKNCDTLRRQLSREKCFIIRLYLCFAGTFRYLEDRGKSLNDKKQTC